MIEKLTYWVSKTDKIFLKTQINSLKQERRRIKSSGMVLQRQISSYIKENNLRKFYGLNAEYYKDSSKEYPVLSKMSYEYWENISLPMKKIDETLKVLKEQYEGTTTFVPEPIGCEREFFNNLIK